MKRLEQLSVDYWAAESIEEQAGQRALMEGHIVRTQLRFWLFFAGSMASVVSSVVLEFIRFRSGGQGLSIGRWLAGMVPGLIGVAALLVVSAAFVRDVYDIPDWQSALEYFWLLLFGRAPFSLFDLRQGPRVGLFSLFGLSPPSSAPIAPYPSVVVKEGKISPEHEEKPLARIGGPGNVVVFRDNAIFLERFGRFVRVAGPGGTFLQRFERVREVLDLRPQERSTDVEALTRDGIPVKTEVQVRFRLMRPPDGMSPPRKGELRAIYRWAWTLAGQCHSRSVNLETGAEGENRWPERVMGNVGGTLRAIIARYRLDQLLEPHELDRNPRREIHDELRDKLEKGARNFGAQILEVRMGPLEPAEDKVGDVVKRGRIASWQAVWKSEARKEEARGEAQAIRERGLARAYAQMEIILALTRGFQELDRRTSLSGEFIAMRFIESLREAWTRTKGVVVPSEALRTLDHLQRMVRRDYALTDGETGGE